ncbi:MAG: TetR/AcrR family transcriptional regulator [Alphaproteobacteria bacterium]|nr:TetR/AcrR family transcriptional regulator [Rhodospirillaceae bacterium]MBT6202978.1 TetR/AcrR family transcriptional regulator [Rhodospirillaceae bacterium]MBT6512859.1 TetR/AcrR family transcriptional regulator [Rhodospirillaceae bacterium]MBT7612749.1 TetR/AcrR family transcriptional regulator [Rhodospirillaceae bacterium]MDG2480285.1 TetR/AcrR family transcriptional regulator [Alphaproteobacteria bacterium]
MAARVNLTREHIVETASRLVDADPGTDLTMRRLATELGVDPMAIYHYVPGKNALMHAIVGRFLGDFQLPEDEGGWQAQLAALCHAFRELAHLHPGAFLIFVTNEKWADNELSIHEAFFGVLRIAGFDDRKTVNASRQLLAYVESFAWGELTDWHRPYSAQERQELDQVLADGRYPVTKSLADVMTSTNADTEFRFGLNILLAGLETELGRT